MIRTANPFFGQRSSVSLLLGSPGIVALVGYIYFTTSSTAVPSGLTLPLLALFSGVNSVVFLAIACLIGAYAAPRVKLQMSTWMNRMRLWSSYRTANNFD